MKKINKKITNFANSKITIVAVFIVLLLFWWGASLVKNPQTSFSVINYSYDLKGDPSSKLGNGKKIQGEFIAKDNHLGILYLRFNDFEMDEDRFDDLINFKIKEKNQKDWYYTNNYKIGLINKLSLFPFGFPVIGDSQNHTYVFEIQPLSKGDVGDISLNKNRTLLTSHQYPINEIF